MVVAFFKSSKAADLQAFYSFDVHCGLYRAAEVVAVLIRLLVVEVLNGVDLTRALRHEVAGGGGVIVDGVCGIDYGSVLEVGA